MSLASLLYFVNMRVMRKPHWQTSLDVAKEKAQSNPHVVDKNVFSKVEAFSIAHSQHIQEVNARGWKMNLSKLVVQAEVGDVEQWHFSGTLDPKDRPFDLNDMNFLAEAAFYIGAKRDGVQISISYPDEPIHFCWTEE
tara:strand:+ start:228 stop:641 length:414 start_codon:yes stop_codon:yes gene_type:complete